MPDFFPPLTDAELVSQARARRDADPHYRPTPAELAAIDRVMIEQTRKRLARERAAKSPTP